ncbi:hypothetical protein D3C80_1917440 [compost metagenome]
MLRHRLGVATATRTLDLQQFLFQAGLQFVQLGQLAVEGVDLAGELAFFRFQRVDTLVVALFELIKLLANGLGHFLHIF